VSFKRQLSKSWVAGLAGALLAALIGYLLHDRTAGSGLVNFSYDLLNVAKRPIVPAEVVLVFMDEESHEKIGQPLNAPWNRALHAQLVDKLTEAGAKAIVFDVVFSDPMPNTAQIDQKLAHSIAASKRVILAADHIPVVGGAGKRYLMPIDALRDGAAAVGSADVEVSRDLVVRQHTLPDDQVPSLSAATAAFMGVRDANVPRRKWVRYYAPANLLPAVSYQDAVAMTYPELFRDKVVFVGARILTRFAGDRKDEYRTPYSFWTSDKSTSDKEFVSGVEIQATMFLNLLRGDWLWRFPFYTERTALIVFGAAIGFLLMQLRPWFAGFTALVLVLAVALATYLVFVSTRAWFPSLILVAQIAVVTMASVTVNSFRLYLERRLYEQTLALYLSPKLVKKFAQDKRFREPGAEKQTLTILFSDIANFTSISEGMDSDDLAKAMNSYFQLAVSQCIHATDGTVVKYIGDSIFAFWNAPDPQKDHAERACDAALYFRDRVKQSVKGQPLVTRLGLHTGIANVGNFGSTHRVDYTALGESINLASRMEGLNKYLGTRLLITGTTEAEISGKFVTRFLGQFRLKGFEKQVDVFELIGRDPGTAPPWLKLYYSALEAFMQRDFPTATNRFAQVLNAEPNDGPSTFYLHKMAEFHVMPPPQNWAGEIEIREK
jgi:adenylate cyclase